MTIGDWLSQIGLADYVQQFESNHIAIDDLIRLTDDDLKEIGIASLGHRKTILSAIAELGQEMAKGTEMELQNGLWFHPQGGFAFVPDKGPNPVHVYLSHIIKQVAAHQPIIASWITHNYPPAGAAEEVNLKFWRELSAYMIVNGDWLLAWKGDIYTVDPTVEAVGAALADKSEAVADLNWPGEARVSIVDVCNSDIKVQTRWGAILEARVTTVENPNPSTGEPPYDVNDPVLGFGEHSGTEW